MSMELSNHKARKRFGQNFLVDQNVISGIIGAINPKPEERIVEIGPGQGALTAPLLDSGANLSLIEIDRDLYTQLQRQFDHYNNLTIYQADALRFDVGQLAPAGDKIRVVGNLPYNISTPLLFHLLSYKEFIRDMHFMLQKEVVDRLAAAPGSKDYGRLSVMVQYSCEVQGVFKVSPGAFRPIPKVDSAIVRITPRVKPKYPACNEDALKRVTQASFGQRRKTLRNSLKSLSGHDDFLAAVSELGIDLSSRPEQLSIRDFALIAKTLDDYDQKN
ncbi:MAG: 16S rRNA (adenine(1518)-N(6)/adenine(1519)-N(6))-dimethyltransferase RsmA [bacterium]